MLLLTISLVLIIIAVYAIYRHFKSRSTNTLDARRHNKNVSLLILSATRFLSFILPFGHQRAAPDNSFIAAAAPTADGLRQIGYNCRLFCGGRPSCPPPLNPTGVGFSPSFVIKVTR